jgi:hypothetical protein
MAVSLRGQNCSFAIRAMNGVAAAKIEETRMLFLSQLLVRLALRIR